MSKTGSVAAQMEELLDEINKEVEDSAKSNMNAVAKESAQKLRNTSPKKSGSYAKGWSVKKRGDMDVIVHNKTDYQLTHLLENGHVVRNKKGTYGRAPGHKHIQPVEEWANNELPLEIERELQ